MVDLGLRLPHAFSPDSLCGGRLSVSAWEVVFFIIFTLTTGVLGFVVYLQNPVLAKILFIISALSLLVTIFDILESDVRY
jgi:hypothetical protein